MELLLFVAAIVLLGVAALIPTPWAFRLLCLGMALFVLAVGWPTITA